MQDHELRDLRRELAAQERGPGRHYPGELKARVVAWARRELARGAAAGPTATAIALDPRTLNAWLETAAQHASVSLIPVEVMPPPAARPSLAVVSPAGYRIEGLTLDEAIAVLRRLG